jgi:hypothetical protein
MSTPTSPFEAQPPSAKRLLTSVVIAIAAAAVILVVFVLPAEFGKDPTGIGEALGLTAIGAPKRALEIKDVIGGNEKYREVKVASDRDPVPLPNPAVVQLKPAVARADTVTVKLQSGEETEVKAVMDAAQVVLYSWKSEGGDVYTDFHGHEPNAGEAFVRYEEQMSGREGHGSLVAPFSGEHGWYWVNVSEQPVTITLQLNGYHKDVINYGLIGK